MTSFDAFQTYNARDAATTIESWISIKQDLIRQGNWNTCQWQRDLIFPLTYMMERGQLMDAPGLREARLDASAKIETLEDELRTICAFHGMPEINPRSTQQLKEYFYIKRKLKPYVSRSTGNITTDEKALKRIARKGFKEAQIILEIRRLTKLKGTYYNILLTNDNRMHCSYNPVGTESGRLSSSKNIFGFGSNRQNMPAEMKSFFLADPDYILYNIDLAQAENRIVAHIAPESKMIDIFENGRDAHSIAAVPIARAFGYQLDEGEVRFQDDEYSRTGDSKYLCPVGRGSYTWRFCGKRSNHSFNYGEGYKYFSFIMEIPERDGRLIWEAWHTLFPGVKQYWRWVEDQLRKNRTLTNCYERKRTFLDRWGSSLFKQAYSFIPQSTVADKINREGLIYIWNNNDLFKPLELLNQVHDSIEFQIPINSISPEQHYKMIARIVKNLEQPITWGSTSFVIPAEVSAGFNLKDMRALDINNKQQFIKTLSSIIEKR